MNIWRYPADLHKAQLDQHVTEQRRVQAQLEMSQAQTSQQIRP